MNNQFTCYTWTWRKMLHPNYSNNFTNGDANLEIAPGIFATYDAYWFLRNFGCVGHLD